MDFKRGAAETELQYGWRLYTYLRNGHLNWQELADLMNRDCRNDETEYRTESAYRKPLQGAQKYWDEVFSKMTSNEDILKDMEAERRELEREKIRFRDERNAWNKQNYIAARVEQKLDYLGEQLAQFGKINFEDTLNKPKIASDRDMIVVLSDIHLGLTFNTVFGSYSVDIAKRRINDYLCEIKRLQTIHDCENVYVALAGDMISGNIHKSVQVANRENVIEQIKIASELITSFCYSLATMFNNVSIISVSGNHSRLDKKDDALKDERLDDLITYIVKQSLSNVDNVCVIPTLDTTIAVFDVRNNKYVLVHGDYDTPTEAGLMRLCNMIGGFPTGIISGHRHTPALSEINGVKMIQSGSLCGSGDDYTTQKRLMGKACQVVTICNNKGIECIYPIEFD